MRAAPREAQGRGVYKAWWQIDGHDVLFAVTSTGQRLKKVVVLRDGVSEERATEWFEELLDRIDPTRPVLALVPPAKQLTVAQIDALYRDASPVAAALWHRKRERLRGTRSVLAWPKTRPASGHPSDPSS